MTELLLEKKGSTAGAWVTPGRAVGGTQDAAARRDLRRQIARLDAHLSHLVIELGAPAGDSIARPASGPRLLGLAELERRRDALAARVERVTRALATRERQRDAARRLLEAMMADPAAYRYAVLPASALGEGGCGVYQVRPRLGLVGMLAGWWEVRLSSGCPRRARLAGASGSKGLPTAL